MAVARQELDIVLRTRAEGLESIDKMRSKIKDLQSQLGKKTPTFIKDLDGQVQGLGRSFRNLSSSLRFFGITAIAALGGVVIRGFINQQEALSRSLGRTRFFLSGFAGGMEQGIQVASKFADSAQRAGLANANLAREIGAKSLVAIKDQTKALRVARAALLGHKLGIFDANSALQALATSNDNNTEALRGFLRGLGIAAPEFASYETLIENFIRRNEDASASLTDFGKAFTRLKGLFAQRAAEIGGIIGEILAPSIKLIADFFEDPKKGFDNFVKAIMGGLAELESQFGIFGIIVGGFIRVLFFPFQFLTTILTELFFQIGQLPKTFDIITTALDDFGKAIGGGIKIVIEFLVKIWKAGWTKIKDFFGAVAEAIGDGMMALIDSIVRVWNIGWTKVKDFFKAVSGTILKVASVLWSALVTGFSVVWTAIKDFTISVWNAIKGFLTTIWEAIRTTLASVWDSIKTSTENAWTGIANAVKVGVNSAIGFINALIEAWNRIEFTLPKVDVPFVGTFGGFTISTPNIPKITPLQEGGIVRSPLRALIGERGPEAVIPLEKMGRFGGITNITITGNTFMDDEDAAVKIGDMIVRRLELVHRFGLTT